MELHKLARETALYSISSIFGKFLNWMMVPLYTFVLAGSADYGIVTNLYSWTTLLQVILTYGMETGFLRFVNSHHHTADKVYSTTWIAVALSSSLFAIACMAFRHPIAHVMGYASHPEYIAMLSCSVALDAFCSIPLVYLRYKGETKRFVMINMWGILAKIALNVFFLVVCPWLLRTLPYTVNWFYDASYGVGYIFVANLIATLFMTGLLLPHTLIGKPRLDTVLLKKLLAYSLPLLLLGVAGIMNQTIDKILFPFLMPGTEGKTELGIYGATSKIAMVIMMFSQAFYYSYEPYTFAKKEDKEHAKTFADSMKFYVLVALLVFVGMILYMDVLKYIIRSDYWTGLQIVPVVMLSYIFQGIYINLSLWYKLTDRTYYGSLFSILGILILVACNVWLVPLFSYRGAAWSSVICYFTIMTVSYLAGRKVLPVKYDFRTLTLYSAVTLLIFTINLYIKTPYFAVNILLKTGLMAAFLVLLVRRDLAPEQIPGLNLFFKQNNPRK